jgi:transcriptional regulator with GAF, ATPase, and Fis domain
MDFPRQRLTQPLAELMRVDRASGRLVVRKYRLAVIDGPDRGKTAPLTNTLALGSDERAGFPLTDPTVSRLHVQLTPRADGVLVKDLASTNGTVIGGLRIEQAVIEHEATLTLGSTLVRIHVDEADLGAPPGPERLGDAVAASRSMRHVLGLLERLAQTDATVVLLGETGAGKDVLAHALHSASSRANKPMVVFDCSAVAANLIESELFGHARGAFTGATADRKGAFLQADGGTLFLDEIGELPLDLQPRLLRAVESGAIKPVGSDRVTTVDVRLVAATHRDLDAAVKAGTLRQDLFYRLGVALVTVPPLRERVDDIPLLVERFVRQMQPQGFDVPPALMAKMIAYHWPGNVRELRNVVSRALLGEHDSLVNPSPSSKPRAGEANLDVPFKEAKERLIDTFTRDYLEALLRRHNGNVSQAARSAGLARPHLHKLAVRYGLKDEGGKDEE